MVTKTSTRLEELVKRGEAVFRPADRTSKGRSFPTFRLKGGMRLERVVKKH